MRYTRAPNPPGQRLGRPRWTNASTVDAPCGLPTEPAALVLQSRAAHPTSGVRTTHHARPHNERTTHELPRLHPLGLIAGAIAKLILPGRQAAAGSPRSSSAHRRPHRGWIGGAVFNVGYDGFFTNQFLIIAILGALVVLVIWGLILAAAGSRAKSTSSTTTERGAGRHRASRRSTIQHDPEDPPCTCAAPPAPTSRPPEHLDRARTATRGALPADRGDRRGPRRIVTAATTLSLVTIPVLLALIIASALHAAVGWLRRHGVPSCSPRRSRSCRPRGARRRPVAPRRRRREPVVLAAGLGGRRAPAGAGPAPPRAAERTPTGRSRTPWMVSVDFVTSARSGRGPSPHLA